ncbi:unnamed protein product [Rodentolepis nana]|uniref:ANK_REP_REGION domain-containing protein n=1 Tax=Rodentolepis nana TaxID=102285 RepID=A0A0R3TZQ1_RODNA|nr:unnamed protein product [Rodentolepis nana]
MAWQRPDIARTRVLVNVNDWSKQTLESAMTDALINDRLEFVQLLLEKGLDIYKFLTDRRLEDLYLASYDSKNHFSRLFRKLIGDRYNLSLKSIGNMLEQIVGNGYQHPYCSKRIDDRLRKKINGNPKQQSQSHGSSRHGQSHKTKKTGSLAVWTPSEWGTVEAPRGMAEDEAMGKGDEGRDCFRYPYTELLQWALLTCRLSLARFMVLSGEEAIAKALLSVRILQGMRKLMDAESETELIRIIRAQEESFEILAVELQEHCYRHDAEQARRLLTYELCNFSGSTCLSLACMCESKPFIAHPCAQAILSDLWYGGLREGRFVSTKVTLILLGLAVPPFYPFIAFCFASNSSKFLEFKTKEELSAQPQTWEEHQDEIETDSSSSSSSSSSSNSSSTSNSRNSYMEDAKTRIIDNFTLATPLALIRPFSEPTLRNPFFQASTKETSAGDEVDSLEKDTLDTLHGLQFPTPTRVRTKSDSRFQTISGYAIPQNPSQTSLFLPELSPTPHLQQHQPRENSTQHSANMNMLEASHTQLTYVNEKSDSLDDLALDLEVSHKDEVKSLPTIQLEGSTITDGEFNNLCTGQAEEIIDGKQT